MITNFKDFDNINESIFNSPTRAFIKFSKNYVFSKDVTTPFIELYPEFKPYGEYSDITAKKVDKNTIQLSSGEKNEYRPEPYQGMGKMGKYLEQSIKIRMKKMTDDFQKENTEFKVKFNTMDQTVTITKKKK